MSRMSTRRTHLAGMLALVGLLLAGCMHEPVHQGNVLKPGAVAAIHEGMTRFAVEQLLGTPVLKDALHPDRAVYVEYFEDEETGDAIARGIDIRYDDALRVKQIRRFGFDDGRNARHKGKAG